MCTIWHNQQQVIWLLSISLIHSVKNKKNELYCKKLVRVLSSHCYAWWQGIQADAKAEVQRRRQEKEKAKKAHFETLKAVSWNTIFTSTSVTIVIHTMKSWYNQHVSIFMIQPIQVYTLGLYIVPIKLPRLSRTAHAVYFFTKLCFPLPK